MLVIQAFIYFKLATDSMVISSGLVKLLRISRVNSRIFSGARAKKYVRPLMSVAV